MISGDSAQQVYRKFVNSNLFAVSTKRQHLPHLTASLFTYSASGPDTRHRLHTSVGLPVRTSGRDPAFTLPQLRHVCGKQSGQPDRRWYYRSVHTPPHGKPVGDSVSGIYKSSIASATLLAGHPCRVVTGTFEWGKELCHTISSSD